MTFETILAYHRLHGDDYANESSRIAKYSAILSLADFDEKHVLDVGCGTGMFRNFLPACSYTGIDLLHGQNVLDYVKKHDIVVANGIFYKLSGRRTELMHRLIRHCWALSLEVLIFNSLSLWAPQRRRGEFNPDPLKVLDFCHSLSGKIAFRHDYSPGNFTIAMYR